MTTPRFPDWQARFGAFVDTRRTVPFEWGGHDCCLFAADCVRAITGVDPAASLRGTYSDAAGAARTLDTLGGVSGVGNKFAGLPVAPLMARVGDVGLVRADGRDALGVCNGDTWLAPGKVGIAVLPLAAALQAWRF